MRELQRESNLDRESVRKGLLGLKRRSLLIVETLPRRGGVYRLVPAARMPEDLRGTYLRDVTHRAQMRLTHLGYRPACAQGSPVVGLPHGGQQAGQASPRQYSVASPPAPSNAPGALRVIVKETSASPPFGQSSCALADFWKKTR